MAGEQSLSIHHGLDPVCSFDESQEAPPITELANEYSPERQLLKKANLKFLGTTSGGDPPVDHR